MNTEQAWEHMNSKRGACVRRESGGPVWRQVWDGGMYECRLTEQRQSNGFTISSAEPHFRRHWIEGCGNYQLGPGSWRHAFEGITDWVACEWGGS